MSALIIYHHIKKTDPISDLMQPPRGVLLFLEPLSAEPQNPIRGLDFGIKLTYSKSLQDTLHSVNIRHPYYQEVIRRRYIAQRHPMVRSAACCMRQTVFKRSTCCKSPMLEHQRMD